MAAAAAKAVARERARRWGLRRGRSLRCRRGDGDGQGKGGQGARKPKAGRLERAGSWRRKGGKRSPPNICLYNNYITTILQPILQPILQLYYNPREDLKSYIDRGACNAF